MALIKVVLLCLSAALVCSMIRTHRPEVAAAVSLAVGIGALLITGDAVQMNAGEIQRLLEIVQAEDLPLKVLFKAAGVAVLSELGVQICCDAGETALGGRIRLACRVAMLGMSLPLILQIVDTIDSLFA